MCDHNWQHLRSQQWRQVFQVEGELVTKTHEVPRILRFLGKKTVEWQSRSVERTEHRFWRADDFYCTKCLEDRLIRRRAVAIDDWDKHPDWWSELIETESLGSFENDWLPHQNEKFEECLQL